MNKSLVLASLVAVAALAAYVLSRNRTRLNRFVYFFIIMCIAMPTNFVTLMKVMQMTHLINTQIGMILLYSTMSIPFSVFLIYAFVGTIPRERDEAASATTRHTGSVCADTDIAIRRNGDVLSRSTAIVTVQRERAGIDPARDQRGLSQHHQMSEMLHLLYLMVYRDSCPLSWGPRHSLISDADHHSIRLLPFPIISLAPRYGRARQILVTKRTLSQEHCVCHSLESPAFSLHTGLLSAG